VAVSGFTTGPLGNHLKINGGVPPVGLLVNNVIDVPAHTVAPEVDRVNIRGWGSVMVNAVVSLHPAESVTSTVYVLADRVFIVLLVVTLGVQLYVYGALPLLTVMVALPFFNPLQVMLAVEDTPMLGPGLPFTMAVATWVQPLLSVIVTL
jgi:voltage-gated potassium channel Kch